MRQEAQYVHQGSIAAPHFEQDFVGNSILQVQSSKGFSQVSQDVLGSAGSSLRTFARWALIFPKRADAVSFWAGVAVGSFNTS